MLNIPCTLPDAQEPAYLVGGSVRDLLLKRTPEDFDIVVPENPGSYAKKLAAMHHVRAIQLGRGDKRIWRVVGGDAVYDISRIKGNSIETDLMQRDFTVNALAYDPGSGIVIDVTNGRHDLAAGQVRMVSSSIFDQDPVRLLRAFRMTAQHGFSIEKQTSALIREKKHLIGLAAGERIREEWFNILKQTVTTATLSEMADTGFLTALFPELEGMRELMQNQYHAFDALTHTLETVGHMEKIFNGLDRHLPRSAEALNRQINSQRRIFLKCAAVLHDMGKPASATMDQKGRRHYYGHEKIGAQMADKIGRRFRFSNLARASVALIVRQHLRPLFLFNQTGEKSPGRKARVRFFMTCGPLAPDVVLHAVADNRAKTAEPGQRHQEFMRFADNLLQEYFTGYQITQKAPRLISGHDLIQKFGLSPSPVFSSVLKQVEEARMAGEIHDRKDALNLAGRILNKDELPISNNK
ncbi:MAG: HD domain-containing protein [Thermodesulfobacteriota bacterium]